jgi:hypothetical protein
MKDSAVVGTYKHAKHSAKKKARYNSSLSSDLRDIKQGFSDIARAYRLFRKALKKITK